MSMRCPIEWTNTYAATIEDHPSFRTIRLMLLRDLKHDADLRDEIATKCGEEFTVAEWDSVFNEIKHQRERALTLLDARVQELGIEL